MSVSSPLKRCKECGIPSMVGHLMLWEQGGIMNIHSDPKLRMAIFHADVHACAVREIEDTLGVSIKDQMFLAEKEMSWNYFTGILETVPGFKSLKELLLKDSFVEGMQNIPVVLGHCYIEPVKYVPGEGYTAYIKNPFNLDLVAAVIVGALEHLEEHSVNYEWEKRGENEYLIKAEVLKSEPETIVLPEVEPQPVSSGEIDIELCPECKAPKILGENFQWEEGQGIVRDMRSGRRYIMLSTLSLRTLFDKLSLEFGDAVYDILVKAQRDWTYNHIESIGFSMYEPHDSEEFQTFFMDYLSVFPVFGYGNPVWFDTDNSDTGIAVENPCNVHMIAGILQGLYESLSQEPSTVSWNETDKGVMKYMIAPKD